MSERRKSDTHSDKKLVRVAGKGQKDQVYDSFGHEITEEQEPNKPKQRVHGSRTEEVKRAQQDERTDVNEDEAVSPGYDAITNPKLRKDKISAIQQRKANKIEEKKRIILAALRVGIFLMCICILILIVIISGKISNQVNTQYIHRGSIDVSATGTLSFVRNEIPVTSLQDGTFVAYVNEGDRVAKDALIGYVVQSQYQDQLRQLREVEAKLISANQALSYVNATKSPELLVVEDAIQVAATRLSQMAMSGDMTEYSTCARELNQLYREKNELLMNMETTDSYLQGLQHQRNEILAQIQNSMYPIVAQESGIVSFYTDGKELVVSNVFEQLSSQVAMTDFETPSSCNISDAIWDGLFLPDSSLKPTNGVRVQKNNVIARVTPDVSYYVTMELNAVEGLEIVPHNTVTVRVKENNLLFGAEICGAYRNGKKNLLVLKCSSALMATVSARQVSGEVIFAQTQGLKVPLRALTEWDEAGVTARITVVRSGYVEYVYVNVLATDHDYAVINSKAVFDDGDGISVRENDEYVVEYEKVKEGQAL